MDLDHANIFGSMLTSSNVFSQEWVPQSAPATDFYQQLGKEACVWLLPQFLDKWLLSQPLQTPLHPSTSTPHHHRHFQDQASHSEHARNVIKALCGYKLIISSGYEQTHGLGFWPCCLMRGHPRGAEELVNCHPKALYGIWDSWFKIILASVAQASHCPWQGSAAHWRWLLPSSSCPATFAHVSGVGLPGGSPGASCSPIHCPAWYCSGRLSLLSEPPRVDKEKKSAFLSSLAMLPGTAGPKDSNRNHLPISMF